MSYLVVPQTSIESFESESIFFKFEFLLLDNGFIILICLKNRIPNMKPHSRYRRTFLKIFELQLRLIHQLRIDYCFIILRLDVLVVPPLPRRYQRRIKHNKHPMSHSDLIRRQRDKLMVRSSSLQQLHITPEIERYIFDVKRSCHRLEYGLVIAILGYLYELFDPSHSLCWDCCLYNLN